MKIQVARASNRDNEHTVNMQWVGQFADELLKLNETIPATENSWDIDNSDLAYVVCINKETRRIEILLYDDYIE